MVFLSKRALLFLAVSVLLVACGSDTPSGPQAGNPTPSPSASATPSGSGALGLACGASTMPDCGPNCCRMESEEGQWEMHLWAAIQALQDEQPGLFDGQKILDRERFLREVSRIAEQRFRLCVKPGPSDDELGVKSANGMSEQYDVFEQNGRLRYPGYDGTCRPARF